MRSGTRTELKRRWKPKGHRPVCNVKIGYKFVYLYAALNPYDGQLVALLLPFMTQECFSIFMDYFEEQAQMIYGDEKILMILDGASNHQSDVINSGRIFLEKLPPACPELNPAERFFEQLRTELSNLVFEELEQVEDYLIEILQKYFANPELICSLTHFTYIRH